MMRVVLVHRYFWPDTPPYAHLLKDIALRLGAAGHKVTVLTCQPSYHRSAVQDAPAVESLGPGVEVRRWPVLPDRRFAAAKALNLAWFCCRLALADRRLRGADVVMAASTPPIAVARVGRSLARRIGARFVYHKQDIYPEVVVAPGILRSRRLATVLRVIDAGTDRAADRVVVLSNDMAATVRSRGTDPARLSVINNFDPWALDAPAGEHGPGPPFAQSRGEGRIRVVFAGNLGRFQGLETVIEAMTALRDDDRIGFDLFGDGALRPHIESVVAERRLRNVSVHGYRPPGEVAEFLRTEAHLGIVSLTPGVIRAAYPSKTLSYLRHGCPVLALVEADSDLARTVVAAGAGFQASPTHSDQVAVTLRDLAGRPWELAGARKRASDLYVEQFSPERQLDRWAALFDQLAEGRAA